MGKTELCKHLGPKVSDGRALAGYKLTFCKDCGEIIVNSIFDVIAYLKKPRSLVNGKIVRSYPTVFGKLEFLLKNIYLLNVVFRRPRGRPPSTETELDKEFDEAFHYPKDMDDLTKIENGKKRGFIVPLTPLTNKRGSGRMPGTTYIRLIKWARDIREIFIPMAETIFKLNSRHPNKQLLFKLGDVFTFFQILAKACLKLNKSQIRAVCACSLVKNGLTYKEASEICRVKYETIKRWEPYFKAFLKKTSQFKYITRWPPYTGLKIIRKNGKIRVEPSIIKGKKGKKAPEWLKIRNGKIIFEK